ncbi:response regulator [Croceicoccus naphthovorans]|uniref:Chemotaxis protein CheY n=1 Tax=Croceicoccus naphthovorans TaxID=1348774 RepID=A0A0G3XF75_9SPHN|nr:response regulator [Croceicoccus naphthovorans]AKM09296.1 chemotaxis protein CheY [Croceicoccus naphthovorans]MBB3990199.1 two-component system cell cycle response regulator DivK [Croceicoccus naphthovorans]
MTERVLVVEDNDLNRKLFCDLLRANGLVVEPCSDGREFIEIALRFDPQVVVMDIQLPHVSGLSLIEAMKGNDLLRHIPILAVTAYAGKGDEERIRDAGAEGYLSKPVSIQPFMAAVNALLDRRAAA